MLVVWRFLVSIKCGIQMQCRREHHPSGMSQLAVMSADEMFYLSKLQCPSFALQLVTKQRKFRVVSSSCLSVLKMPREQLGSAKPFRKNK